MTENTAHQEAKNSPLPNYQNITRRGNIWTFERKFMIHSVRKKRCGDVE